MSEAAERPDSALVERLRSHLGVEPNELPVTVADFAVTDHANLQLALDAVLAGTEVIGYSALHMAFQAVGLSIVAGVSAAGPIKPGPVQYANVEVGDGRVIQCVSAGLYLAERDGAPVVLVVSRSDRPFGGPGLRFEGISPEAGALQATLDALREAMRLHNVFRGRTISLHAHDDHSVSVVFHALPSVARDAVILPRARSSGSSGTRWASPSTPSACAPPAGTSSAGSSCTARPAPARRCRSTTCWGRCRVARRSCSPAAGWG